MALFYVTGLSGTGKSAVRGELQCFQAVARYGEQELGVHQLVKGVFTDAARQRFVEVITRLGADDCDAVALVCTEFPLLISPEVSPLPTLDSTDLLARAAVNTAVGGHLPAWRGGPPTD
jgi:aspartate/glutamate racemase